MAAIPFNCISRVGTEGGYIEQAFEALQICGDGVFSRRCHEFLENTLGVARALLTTSCSHALEMCALLLDIKPGDEVIIPTYTFPSVANAFVLRGAKPIFADIRPDTLNLDESKLRALITPATRAIVVVHYAGVACEMDEICALADEYGIEVVEDNAHGLFGGYRNKPLGTFGCMATQSFHETKNFSCGEGGALLLNDASYCDRAEIIREKGTNRKKFFRGEVDKYSWVDIGSSYLLSDILAAILFAQFEVREAIQKKRERLWCAYERELANWATNSEVRLPVVPAHCQQTHHIFYLLMPDMTVRDALIEHLRVRQILSVFHYVPLHTSKMGRQLGGYAGQCPVAEDVSNRLIRLPLYSGLTEEEQERIFAALHAFEPVCTGRSSEEADRDRSVI